MLASSTAHHVIRCCNVPFSHELQVSYLEEAKCQYVIDRGYFFPAHADMTVMSALVFSPYHMIAYDSHVNMSWLSVPPYVCCPKFKGLGEAYLATARQIQRVIYGIVCKILTIRCCFHIYIYICTYTYTMYVCIYIYICISIDIYVYIVCVYIYIYVLQFKSHKFGSCKNLGSTHGLPQLLAPPGSSGQGARAGSSLDGGTCLGKSLGKSVAIWSIWMVYHGILWDLYGIYMGFYGIYMGFYRIFMGFYGIFMGFIMGFYGILWDFMGFIMGFIWDFMDFYGIYYGILWDFMIFYRFP